MNSWTALELWVACIYTMKKIIPFLNMVLILEGQAELTLGITASSSEGLTVEAVRAVLRVCPSAGVYWRNMNVLCFCLWWRSQRSHSRMSSQIKTLAVAVGLTSPLTIKPGTPKKEVWVPDKVLVWKCLVRKI